MICFSDTIICRVPGTTRRLKASPLLRVQKGKLCTRLRTIAKPCAQANGRQGDGQTGARGKVDQASSQSVAPSTGHSTPQGLPQRSLFAGGVAVFLGLAAVALWNSQHWRLPWQRKRQKLPPQSPQPPAELSRPIPEDLAGIVDDLPQVNYEEGPEAVERLRAARVALEQRLLQLDRVNDPNRGGISTPFIPSDDRPWRSASSPPGPDALKAAIEASRLRADPTADVSYIDEYWGSSLSQEGKAAEGGEAEDSPPSSRSSIGSDAAGSSTQEGTARLSDLGQTGRTEEETQAEELSSISSPPTVAAEAGAGLLPGLSKEVDSERDGNLLPKASELTFVEEPATPKVQLPVVTQRKRQVQGLHPCCTAQELEAVHEDIAPVEPSYVRRSQKPVPKVAGQLRLVAAGACIPAPAKLAAGKGGEDAFFVSEALWGAVGVADGVGSWSLDGVDPSLYSRRLLEVAAAATEHGWGRRRGQGVRGLLHIAQTGTMDVAGTSTACVAQMVLGRTLQVANLGDSGFRIFRGAECLFGSEVQQHSFNCPYQAGSPKLHPHCNTADDAAVYEIDLQEHDLVLLATDGVFDNLWDHELSKLIGSYMNGRDGSEVGPHEAAAVASLVVEAAHERGLDPRSRTPWIVEAAKRQPDILPWHLRYRPRGGKPDDCTVVAAFMKADDNQY